jgi:hypothetical protein
VNGPDSIRAGVTGAGGLATVGGTPVFDPGDHPPTVSVVDLGLAVGVAGGVAGRVAGNIANRAIV